MSETPADPTPAQPSPGTQPDGARGSQLQLELRKLLDFGRQHVHVRLKQVRAAAQRALWFIFFGLFVAVVGVAALMTSVWMLFTGAAAGIAEGAGLPLWGGRVIVALGALLMGGGYLVLYRLRSKRALLRAALREYEERRRVQQLLYGTDVERVAREQLN